MWVGGIDGSGEMPETPNFELIARQIHFAATGETLVLINDDILPIADQLRLIWNARGAADLAMLETTLSSLMGSTASGPYLKNLDRALRQLDR